MMLLFAAIAIIWTAPLVWLMRLADREIRAAQAFRIELPPKRPSDLKFEAQHRKALIAEPEPMEHWEAEYADQDTERLPQAA